MGQFDWKPETYLELIRSEIPRYDELQEQAIAAIPFAPERVLELGMGTGETTRRLIEAYPDAWVIGLDSSPDMVFRAREIYDDVQLARIEDPLPDGPWDLVIGVLSIHHLRAEQKQNLFRQVNEQARALVIGDVVKADVADHPDRRGLRLPGDGRGPGRVVRGRGHLAAGRPGVVRADVLRRLASHRTCVLGNGGAPSPLPPPAATIPRPMAVPKKRTSSARRDKRRANHKAGKASLNSCPRCHSPRLPHRVCPTCGTYAGREVVSHEVADPPATATDSE